MAGGVRDSPAGGDPRTKRGYGFAKETPASGRAGFPPYKAGYCHQYGATRCFHGVPFHGVPHPNPSGPDLGGRRRLSAKTWESGP